MKIYRATKREDGDAHAGYKFFFSKREAKLFQKDENFVSGVVDEVDELEVSMNKCDVLAFLNAYASHPDNG